MPVDPPYSDSWNTPENNPLYPIPIQPMDPDDPLLSEDSPKPAGAYRLDIGMKPVRTREELRALLSFLGAIQRHIETLELPNVQVSRTAIANISDKISLDMIDEEFTRAGLREENIIFNRVEDDEVQIL
ncbi:hypothetical protein [Acidiphilium multivorum]|uniref:hypothetical protein n=1 Tax=Acidiphilium multivorum TaxID=62140 RepID=UPI001F4BE179|nr:hypothetical protein [Acidiphilium multivorum]